MPYGPCLHASHFPWIPAPRHWLGNWFAFRIFPCLITYLFLPQIQENIVTMKTEEKRNNRVVGNL